MSNRMLHHTNEYPSRLDYREQVTLQSIETVGFSMVTIVSLSACEMMHISSSSSPFLRLSSSRIARIKQWPLTDWLVLCTNGTSNIIHEDRPGELIRSFPHAAHFFYANATCHILLSILLFNEQCPVSRAALPTEPARRSDWHT